jgi:hypothetical protein
MRTLNYKVNAADGSTFVTTDFIVASKPGNRILESFFTDVNEIDKKQEEYRKKRIEKIWKKK